MIGFFAQSIYLRAKGQLIINHSAQIFIMLHLLNSRVIDQDRGRDCGSIIISSTLETFMFKRDDSSRLIKSATAGLWVVCQYDCYWGETQPKTPSTDFTVWLIGCWLRHSLIGVQYKRKRWKDAPLGGASEGKKNFTENTASPHTLWSISQHIRPWSMLQVPFGLSAYNKIMSRCLFHLSLPYESCKETGVGPGLPVQCFISSSHAIFSNVSQLQNAVPQVYSHWVNCVGWSDSLLKSWTLKQ